MFSKLFRFSAVILAVFLAMIGTASTAPKNESLFEIIKSNLIICFNDTKYDIEDQLTECLGMTGFASRVSLINYTL